MTTPDWDLQFVLRGRGRVAVDGKPMTFQEGDLLLVRPGESFKPEPIGGEPFDRFFIHFTPVAVGGRPPVLSPWLDFRTATVIGRPALRLLMERLIHERYQRGPGKALADLLLTEFLLRLATPSPVRKGDGTIPQHQQHLLERIASRLAGSFETRENLSALADEMGLSVNHFVRLFRRHTGSTPHQFRLQARLDHGKLLLASGSHSITEVAARTGWGDLAQFSTAFRKHFGQSPKAYLASF